MKLSASQILGEAKSYFLIALGLFIYVLGVNIFVLPNELVGGGASGISALMLYAFNIPMSVSFFIFNVVLLLIGIKILGNNFGAKTIFAIIVCTLFYDLVPRILPEALSYEIGVKNGKLISAIFGGICAGLGIGMSFIQGGSTGGTDIIALIICKYKKATPGRMILLMDIFIVASSLLLPADPVLDAAGNVVGHVTWGQRIATVLYGYVLIGTCGFSIDYFVSGSKQSVQAFIFSKKYREIADAIMQRTGRGVTIFDAEGAYTKDHNKVLLVVLRKADINVFYKLMKEVDKEAFMSMGSVASVYGKGFDEIKI